MFVLFCFFFFKHKTAYEVRISDWSSDVCSSDLVLRGKPGARRVEVTARGKVVRDLSTQSDVQGKSVHLTIDAELQYYAARRIGPESGSVVVIDCLNGDFLPIASMPSFYPNSFLDGIASCRGRVCQ